MGFSLRAGFTLLELIVVVGLIAILGSVFISLGASKRQSTSGDAKIKDDVNQLVKGLKTYRERTGSFPNSTLGLDALAGGELKEVPSPPPGAGSDYSYEAGPSGCEGTSASPCSSVAVFAPLFDGVKSGDIWCFRSASGSSELAASSCLP